MERVTLFESIIKILKTISSIPLFIEILILTIFLLIIMIFFYFRKSKIGRTTSLIIYCVTLCLLPITHFSFFVDTIDKIIENYIKILYFPSCYVYMVTLIITDMSLLLSMLKNIKENNRKWYMIVDLIYFAVFQFLFFMILRLVITNNVDIFDRTQLYSNTNLTSCIQISSYLFWIRIGVILISKLITKLSNFELNRKVEAMEPEPISSHVENKKEENKVVSIKEDKKSNASNDDLIKRLLEQDYTSNTNNSGNINKKGNVDRKTENIFDETDDDDYFYDDFFE